MMPLVWMLAVVFAAVLGALGGAYGAWKLLRLPSYRQRWQEALAALSEFVKQVDAADAAVANAQQQVRSIEAQTAALLRNGDAKTMELHRLLTDAERRALIAEEELTSQGSLRARVNALEAQVTRERLERQRLEAAAIAASEGR